MNFELSEEGYLNKRYTYNNYLLLDTYPLQKNDPTKLLRVMAFSGICGVQEDINGLDKISSELFDKKKKGFRLNKREFRNYERDWEKDKYD